MKNLKAWHLVAAVMLALILSTLLFYIAVLGAIGLGIFFFTKQYWSDFIIKVKEKFS